MRIGAGILAGFLVLSLHLPAQSIGNCSPKVIAGPVTTDAGDGGPAMQAQLNDPVSFARDASGNIYIADLNNYRVRMISPDGVIHAFAGNGTRAYSGDGGPATAASFISPAGVAVSPSGEVYISDNVANVVRKVSQDGTIHTVAGNGYGAFGGDGGPATAAMLNEPEGIAFDPGGNLYVADMNNNRIRKVDTNGVITTLAGGGSSSSIDGVPAITAQFLVPDSVAADANGTIYFDSNQEMLFSVTSDGILHHLAGAVAAPRAVDGSPALTVSFRLDDPAIDAGGNVVFSTLGPENGVWRLGSDGVAHFVARTDLDYGLLPNKDGTFTGGTQNQVLSYSPTVPAGSGLSPSTVIAGVPWVSAGDGGPAMAATFESVTGVAADSAGNIYIADGTAGVIRKVGANGAISTFAGNGGSTRTPDGVPAAQTALLNPGALAMGPDGSLYYAEDYDVRKIGPNGTVTTVAGTGAMPSHYGGMYETRNGAQATSVAVWAGTIAVDPSGNVYLGDTLSGVAWEVTQDGKLHELDDTTYVAADAARRIFLSDVNAKLYEFNAGSPQLVADMSQWIPLAGPFAMDTQGNYYAAGIAFQGVIKRTPAGAITWLSNSPLQGTSYGIQSAPPFQFTSGIAMDAAGDIYVADTKTPRVAEIAGAASCAGSAFPVIAVDQPVNAASYRTLSVSPGELVAIFGQNIGPANLAGPVIANGAFATEAGSTQVFFNNIPAPIVYASSGQTAAMVPFEVASEQPGITGAAMVEMKVVVNGFPSATQSLGVLAQDPGLFTQDSSGKGLGSILNQDYSLNGPAQPAPKGSTVMVYGTGFGMVSPLEPDGQLTTAPWPLLTNTFLAQVNGIDAPISYAGAAPALIDGAVQLNVQIPSNAPSGLDTLTIYPSDGQPGNLSVNVQVQ